LTFLELRVKNGLSLLSPFIDLRVFLLWKARTNRNKLRRNTNLSELQKMIADFNLLASTMRGSERQMCYELEFLLKEAGDTEAKGFSSQVLLQKLNLASKWINLQPLILIGDDVRRRLGALTGCE
jgi:hypothetical protein